MRNNTPELVSAVTAPTITTAIAARLNFKSGTIFLWTGIGTIIAPANTGDSVLDGQTFDALAHEMVEIGENTFSMGGSGELVITLNVPAAPDVTIAAASVYPNEYQGRSAVLWRVVKIDTGNPLAQPVWLFRRIRSGTMDKVSIQADGTYHKFALTIESHSGKISNVTNQTYLNQRRYDSNDSSQDFAPSIANGDPAPTKANTAGVYSPADYGGGYGGGYGGYGGGYRNYNQLL
jgi:hypothetical protein